MASFATGDSTSVHVGDTVSDSVEGEVNPPILKLNPEIHRCSFNLEPNPDQGKDEAMEAEDDGVVVVVGEAGEGVEDRTGTEGLDTDGSENEAPWRRRGCCSEECCC